MHPIAVGWLILLEVILGSAVAFAVGSLIVIATTRERSKLPTATARYRLPEPVISQDK